MTPVLNQQEDAVTCHTTKPEKTGICQPWRTVFEGWPFSASARPEAIWEYLGQKFSFQGSLYWLIQILTGTGFQFRVECPIMRCPNGRKEPEQQVNPSWCTRRPRPCGVGPRTGLRPKPATRVHPGSLSSPPTTLRSRPGWHISRAPRALGLTNGRTTWEHRHPWRSQQPSSGQTSESRCAGASREPGCHFCLTHHRFYLHIPPPRETRPL